MDYKSDLEKYFLAEIMDYFTAYNDKLVKDKNGHYVETTSQELIDDAYKMMITRIAEARIAFAHPSLFYEVPVADLDEETAEEYKQAITDSINDSPDPLKTKEFMKKYRVDISWAEEEDK